MLVKHWSKLPLELQVEAVRPYYDILRKKKFTLICKRTFDIIVSIVLLVLFSPVFVVISILIKRDSLGPIFYRQERVTQYGKYFKIFKFRTMVNNADTIGSLITSDNDVRITPIGKILRKYRLDEVPQLLNILSGDMTFVGTRPEVPKFVVHYTDEMKATLLLPAGVTSQASIEYKDEEYLLDGVENIDNQYIEKVLPEKMNINLKSLKHFSVKSDLIVSFRTLVSVI